LGILHGRIARHGKACLERRQTLAGNDARHKFDLAGWSKLARLGSTNAISGLSQMVNQEITISALNLEEVSKRNATGLIGKADELMVGVYLGYSGNNKGHIVLAFQQGIAFELVDMAMGLPQGSTQSLGEMEQSVLGEMGNVVGAFFLNAVADNAGGLRLLPTPPTVMTDTAVAMLVPVMAEALGDNESVFVIRLIFSTVDREIEGRFLVLPNSTSPATSI